VTVASAPVLVTVADATNENSAAISTVAKAHAKKPWAVSRKNISSVRMPTHLVRRRPVRYPPSAEANHWVTINPMAAATPNVVGDGFENDHGRTVARPAPEAKVKSMNEMPIAASAPPAIAAHSTADAELSTDCSGTRTACFDVMVIAALSAKIERGE